MKNRLSWCYLFIEAVFDDWYPDIFRVIEDKVIHKAFVLSLWEKLTNNPFPEEMMQICKEKCEKDITLYQGDKEEVLLSSLSFYASFLYRLAHVFYCLNYMDIARIITRICEEKCGIFIHYSLEIKGSIYLNHARGLYIDENQKIDENLWVE